MYSMPPLPPSDRSKQLNVRLAPEDVDALQYWADKLGLTVSDFIRFSIQHQMNGYLATVSSRDDFDPISIGEEWALALKQWELNRMRQRRKERDAKTGLGRAKRKSQT